MIEWWGYPYTSLKGKRGITGGDHSDRRRVPDDGHKLVVENNKRGIACGLEDIILGGVLWEYGIYEGVCEVVGERSGEKVFILSW